MAFEYQTGESFDNGGDYVRTPGTYHFIVEHIDDRVTKQGAPWPEVAFEVGLKVLAGTAPHELDKKITYKFFNPKSGSKDGGKFARLKIDRFWLAVGLVKPEDAGKKVTIEPKDALGRQLVMEMEQNGKYLDIAFANIFHIDDPEHGLAINESAANKLPASMRKIGNQAKPAPAAPAAPATPTNLAEL